MKLKELEDLRDMSEIDMLHKLIHVAQGCQKRLEEAMMINKQAAIDVRKPLRDVAILAEIIRDEIGMKQKNKRVLKPRVNGTKLDQAIANEIRTMEIEEEYIKKLEAARIAKQNE